MILTIALLCLVSFYAGYGACAFMKQFDLQEHERRDAVRRHRMRKKVPIPLPRNWGEG